MIAAHIGGKPTGTSALNLADADLESVARLLAAIASPCECERGDARFECGEAPLDRWERRWAEGAL